MGCNHNGNLTICSPTPTKFGLRAVDKCPDCGKHTRMIYADYEWYGRNQTCLRCGRRWSDGEWMPLAFERGARKKSVERAKKHYRRMRDAKEPKGEA